MPFIANENIPRASILLIRGAGYRIEALIEDSPGMTDKAVLQKAAADHAILLTLDHDFSELIFNQNLASPRGIVCFRFTPANPLETGQCLLDMIASPDIALENMFTTVEREGIKQRPLLR